MGGAEDGLLQACNEALFIAHSHFSLPPAIPITLAFLIDAIWPTIDPTAPEAADTNTRSSSFNFAGPSNAEYAVNPGIPSIPSAVVMGAVPVLT